MIRTVLAVVLSAALLAAAQPAVKHAAEDRSAAQVRADLDALDAAATDLAETEEVAPGGPGASRSVTVELPPAGVGAAPVRRVVVTPANRTYRYHVAGRSPKTVEGTVPVATASGEPLVLRGAGTHRLVLSLRGRGSLRADADRRIVVRRATPGAAGAASLAAGASAPTGGAASASTVRTVRGDSS